MAQTTEQQAWRQLWRVTAAVGLAVVAAAQLQHVPQVAGFSPLIIAWVLLAVPYRIADRHPGGPAHHGLPSLDWRRWLREALWALGFAALVLPPYVCAFWLWHQPAHAFVWRWPPQPASFALGQLLVIALPEEAFFRGYWQTRLQDARPAWGAWQVWAAQAAVFALLHAAVDLHPARLVVFFPGLVFGWLRTRRRGIEAAVVFHALCNFLGFFLTNGWLVANVP